jgi:hypothetical protein
MAGHHVDPVRHDRPRPFVAEQVGGYRVEVTVPDSTHLSGTPVPGSMLAPQNPYACRNVVH